LLENGDLETMSERKTRILQNGPKMLDQFVSSRFNNSITQKAPYHNKEGYFNSRKFRNSSVSAVGQPRCIEINTNVRPSSFFLSTERNGSTNQTL
jgi:hypothetical protein